MNIDLTKLITGSVEELAFREEVVFPLEMMRNTPIRRVEHVFFEGKVFQLCGGDYQIMGTLSGDMILPDDVTLEDVDVAFSIEIIENFGENGKVSENNLEIVQNRLDITEFLWQNILVEIPLKVVREKNRDLTLEGNGWRLITEDELKCEKESPFSELSKMFDSRKE